MSCTPDDQFRNGLLRIPRCADVLADKDPTFRRGNFRGVIRGSARPSGRVADGDAPVAASARP